MKNMIIAMLMIALVAVSGCVITSQTPADKQTINVAGQSELTFKPDKAEVWAGISIVKPTAEAAQTEANRIISAVIDGLRYKGIQESDIGTDQLSLYEEREWKDGTSTVIGWRATQTLKIKTTDLAKVGTIVDVSVSNGANQINNIQFGLSDAKEAEYKKQALAEATKNARDKAETIASSLGVKLGKIQSVSESNYEYRPYVYAMSNAAGDAAVKEAAVVMPSDVSVNGYINIVYLVE